MSVIIFQMILTSLPAQCPRALQCTVDSRPMMMLSLSSQMDVRLDSNRLNPSPSFVNLNGLISSSPYQAVNSALVQRNWLIGYRIAEEELQGDNRAEYGASIIKKLAKELTAEYGKGYTKTNLYHFYSFYKTYPEIFHSASGKLLLSWTHYRTLLQVNDKDARDWYEKEALEQTWSVATLQRNISSQYYYRMLQTQRQDLVENEMKELTAGYQNDKYEFIKSPVIAEFLGFAQNTDFTESDLEKLNCHC